MAVPEIVGSPVIKAGENVRSLGLDVEIPQDTVHNLIVVGGWKQGGGSITAISLYVDGVAASLSGSGSLAGEGSDNIRMTLAQWRGLTAGKRRVHMITASSGSFTNAFLIAVLLSDAGVATLGQGFTFPGSTPGITANSRYLLFYWGYGATDILDGDLTSVLRVPTIGYGLGALNILTLATTSALGGGFTVGPNSVGESADIGGYAVVPYSAT